MINNNQMNIFSEFKDKSLELAYQKSDWLERKKYYFISYFTCTFLFFLHGFFDYNRTFITSSANAIFGLRFLFLCVCIHFIYFYKDKNTPSRVYEYCFGLCIISILIILLLTIFTGGSSHTLHIGVMIMAVSFYIALPGKALYSLISGILVSCIYIFLGNNSDPNNQNESYIKNSSNFILAFFSLNQQRYSRLEFLHHKRLNDVGDIKSKVLSTLAHDISSPLSVILMIAELGQNQVPNKNTVRTEEYFTRIGVNIKKIDNLIKQLIDWTLEHSNQISNEDTKDIKKSVDAAIEYVKDMADLKNIKIVNQLEAISLTHEPLMVETIFRNLLSNAIKFTPENQSIYLTSKIDSSYRISILDKAEQLTDDQIKSIIHREGNTSTHGTGGEKGHGLGLQLVHSFLNAHKATLNIRRNNSGGNIFTTVFPL